jgi:hypothetical protein
VILRDDQYDKLKRWKDCVCDIYVNLYGDVCLRKFERDPPHGGAVFAQTSWLKGYAEDAQGYPVFQGVRGVCAKINGTCPLVVRSPILKLNKAIRAIKTMFIREGRELTLDELQSKRQGLYQELAAMKRQHFQCLHPQDDPAPHTMTGNCKPCFDLRIHVDERAKVKAEIAKLDLLVHLQLKHEKSEEA